MRPKIRKDLKNFSTGLLFAKLFKFSAIIFPLLMIIFYFIPLFRRKNVVQIALISPLGLSVSD